MWDTQPGTPSQQRKDSFVDDMVKQLLIDQLRELQEEARQLRDRSATEPLPAQLALSGGAHDRRPTGR